MTGKLPWMKWYGRDWRKDPGVRRAGYAARGLWADLLSLMQNDTDAYGFLVIDGVGLEAEDIASIFGGSQKEVAALLRRLEVCNVFSRVGTVPADMAHLIPDEMPVGAIISRRMVRDKAKEEKDRRNGKGGGNPKLKPADKEGVNPTLTKPDNPSDKAQKVRGSEGQNDDVFKPPPLDGPAEPRDPHLQLAREIIAAYGRAVQEVWNLPTAPMPKWGTGKGDLPIAAAWAQDGVTLDLVLEVLGPVLAKKRDQPTDNEPPGGLIYLDKAVRRKLAEIVGKPAEPVDPVLDATAQRYIAAVKAWKDGGKVGEMPRLEAPAVVPPEWQTLEIPAACDRRTA